MLALRPRPVRRLALLAGLTGAALTVPLPASAVAEGPPTMGLDGVRAGMACVGQSVVRGTQISSFDVEILDVVAGDAGAREPFILLRASGPALAGTGLGQGFSGSPVWCPGSDGVLRIVGAVSEAIGQYGNDVALATPIGRVLGEPVEPPAPRSSVRVDPGLLRSARPLAAPLTVSGLSPAVARALGRAAARTGRAVRAAPARPRQAPAELQPLAPGSSVAIGLSSGDVAAGAVGTVAYVDGDHVWAFGHPFESAGRRRLFLQDAYVYTVVGNPIGAPELVSYKLAAPLGDRGVFTNDGIAAVVGRLGALPPVTPMKVVARDEDSGRLKVAEVRLADERSIGLPAGASALSQVGPFVVAQLAYSALGATPARQSGEMCVRIGLQGQDRPLRFCNTYVGGTPGGLQGLAGGPLVQDFAAAARLVDEFRFGPLVLTGVEVNLRLRRDLRQAFLLDASAPGTVRRGRTIRVRVRLRRVDGPAATRTIRVRVPRGMPAGPRELVLTGAAADAGGGGEDALEEVLDLGALLEEEPEDETGPRDVAALRRAVADLAREDGVTASFRPPGAPADEAGEEEPGGAEGIARRERQVLRDPGLRISGSARVLVEVR